MSTNFQLAFFVVPTYYIKKYGGIVLKKNIFIGCGTALVTPFTEDGVDFDTLKKLIDFQIQQGTDALIILGTTGESSTMTLEEKKQVAKFAIDNVHRQIPVIIGAGGNNTKDVIEFNKYADKKNCIGRTTVNTTIFFVDENRNQIEASFNNPGYMAFKGDMNMRGYYKEPEITKEALEN